MAFTKEDKILIKVYRQEKGYGARRIMKEFPNRSWSLSSLSKLLNKIDQTGTVDRKPSSGKKRSTRTGENVELVEGLALSQENKPGTHRSVRQIARDIGISKTAVHDIIAKDLKLVCFKKRQAQDLTTTNKITRLVRAKQLLKKYPGHTILLSRETPDFISPKLWPPNSPDLNPVDYHIWSVLEERVYRTRIRDIDHLRARLIEEWQLFDQVIIDRAIKQWRPRLRSCVREKGGHFEHQL